MFVSQLRHGEFTQKRLEGQALILSSLLFYTEKNKENDRKGFFFPGEALKSLGQKGRTQKSKEFLAREKSKEFQKSKEDQGGSLQMFSDLGLYVSDIVFQLQPIPRSSSTPTTDPLPGSRFRVVVAAISSRFESRLKIDSKTTRKRPKNDSKSTPGRGVGGGGR